MTFKLSEKKFYYGKDMDGIIQYLYHGKDIKEFIRLLKEDLDWVNNKSMEHKELSVNAKQLTNLHIKNIKEVIDRLSGFSDVPKGCGKFHYIADYKKGEEATAMPCGQDGRNYCLECSEDEVKGYDKSLGCYPGNRCPDYPKCCDINFLREKVKGGVK